MDTIKATKDMKFDVKYADGEIREVQEGILIEFVGDRMKAHVGTGKASYILAAHDAILEIIEGYGLEDALMKRLEGYDTL